MKVEKILKLFENMTLFEINKFIKLFEEKYSNDFNVSDITNNKKNNTEEKKENISYKINLLDFGKNKISIIKIIKDFNNLGLKEAKSIVESAPVLIRDNLDYDLSTSLKDKLEKAGAKIEIIKNE